MTKFNFFGEIWFDEKRQAWRAACIEEHLIIERPTEAAVKEDIAAILQNLAEHEMLFSQRRFPVPPPRWVRWIMPKSFGGLYVLGVLCGVLIGMSIANMALDLGWVTGCP